MSRYLANENFFNERYFYGGEVYSLEPSEIARITAKRQMHHLRLLEPDPATEPAKAVDPLDEMAAKLVAMPTEQRRILADKCEKLTAGEEKTEEQPQATEQPQGTGQPPAPSEKEQVGKPMSRAELVELAEKKGIKTDGLSKAQILEKLAAAAPGA